MSAKAKSKKPADQKTLTRTLSPEQARREYFPTIGRGTFYEYLKTGAIPSIRFGERKIVLVRQALERMLETGKLIGQRVA